MKSCLNCIYCYLVDNCSTNLCRKSYGANNCSFYKEHKECTADEIYAAQKETLKSN